MTSGSRRGIDELLSRDYSWTPQQRRVLDLIARGRSNRQVAEELGISVDGAKWHMREILSKLGVESRDEAAEYWRRHNGWPSRLGRVFPGFAWLTAPRAAVVTVLAFSVCVTTAAALLLWIGNTPPTAGRALDERPGTWEVRSTEPVELDPVMFAAVRAVAVQDWLALIDLAEPTDVPCSAVPLGVGPGPSCGPGEADGQLVPSVVRFVCNSAWGSVALLRSSPPEVSGRYHLHSILMGGPALEAGGRVLTPSAWALFLASPGQPSAEAPVGLAVAFGDDGVLGFGQSCGDRQEFLNRYVAVATGWLIPPQD